MRIVSESLERGSFGMMVKIVTLEDGSKYQHMEGEQGGNYALISPPTKKAKPLGQQGLYHRKKDGLNRICFIPIFGFLYFFLADVKKTNQIGMKENDIAAFFLIQVIIPVAIIAIIIKHYAHL